MLEGKSLCLARPAETRPSTSPLLPRLCGVFVYTGKSSEAGPDSAAVDRPLLPACLRTRTAMPVLVKRTRSESRRRSRTQGSAGVRRNSTSNARNKRLIRKGALQMHDGIEVGRADGSSAVPACKGERSQALSDIHDEKE